MASNPAELPQKSRLDTQTIATTALQDTNSDSPVASDNDSIESISENSDSSTLRYDQTSYELFEPRVESLCQKLWPPHKSMLQTLANSKFATCTGATKLLNLFIPVPEVTKIERLRGGDYNRIVGITLPLSKSDMNHNCDLILRVPRWGQGQLGRAVATLDYLRLHSSIPVAKVVAKDLSKENVLESPYMIQSRIPGTDLEILWTDINHSQRCTIAQELGCVTKCLLALEFPVTGHLESSSAGAGTVESHTIFPFDLKSADGDPFKESEQQAPPSNGAHRQNQSTLDFFKGQIGRWRAVDVARGTRMVNRTVGLWDSMLKVIEDMNDLGFFQTNNHCLCHVDLHPRNIMVEIQPNSTVKLTGILDWDESVVAPKFMACEPPGWLWGFDSDSLPHGDVPSWPYEISGANDTPSTIEEQELKRVFEEQAGTEYLKLAYEEEHRLSRGLFRIAVFGLTSSENYNAAERIISDWTRLHPSSI